MKKNFAILLTIVLVASLCLMACSDDDKNVCEEAADVYISALNEVCAEYPDCTICDASDESLDEEALACEGEYKQASQACVDNKATCKAGLVDTYKMSCEMTDGFDF
jgi:hypothetical protein